MGWGMWSVNKNFRRTFSRIRGSISLCDPMRGGPRMYPRMYPMGRAFGVMVPRMYPRMYPLGRAFDVMVPRMYPLGRVFGVMVPRMYPLGREIVRIRRGPNVQEQPAAVEIPLRGVLCDEHRPPDGDVEAGASRRVGEDLPNRLVVPADEIGQEHRPQPHGLRLVDQRADRQVIELPARL